MNMTLIATAGLLALLLAFSAFFSASETALTSLTKAERRRFAKGQKGSDRAVTRVLRNPSRMLTTILVGNNIVNVWSSSIATAFAIGLFGDEGIAIATGFMTVIILIFSEITPKTVAASKPDTFAPALAPAIELVETLLFPIATIFLAINRLFIAIMKRVSPDKRSAITGDEVKTLMAIGKKEGALEETEHRLLARAFDFTDRRIREIMTPRTAIAAVPINSGLDGVMDAFRAHRYSRLPVYADSLDDIKGMIHYKDFLFRTGQVADDGKDSTTLTSLMRPVLFVPETQTAWELLREMEKSSQNMAIVLDEHGSTAGLVTIDDAIAAVFGGIRDEYDSGSSEPIDKVILFDETHLTVPGNLKLDELSALIKIPVDSDWYDTVGGFILERADKLPERGESVRSGPLEFRVDELSGRKIDRVSIFIENGAH